MIKIDCAVKTMSKEGIMKSKKWSIYINPIIRSDTSVAYSLWSPSTF